MSLLAAGTLTSQAAPTSATPTDRIADSRPNIIFIYADDLDRKVLQHMPNVERLLAKEGATFDNFIYNIALCCPSRATMLRGQYAHNTGIYSNKPEDGGFKQVYELGIEKSTIATWLQDSGYETGYIGKYFNGYTNHTDVRASYVPPGWDEWFVTGGGAYDGFRYRVNSGGSLVHYGADPEDYSGDVIAGRAQAFLREMAASTQPFYLTISTFAPHHPFTPAPRHSGLFQGVTYPQTPSFNEADVRDKPLRPRLLTRADIENINAVYRKRLQAAQSIDEMVADLVSTLERQGKLDDTIIAFTSDNGFHLGEHRLAPTVGGKHSPYEQGPGKVD